METRRRGLTIWIAVLLAFSATFLPAGQVALVHAQTAGIIVMDNSVQSAFPTQIQFGVRTQSSSQIALVRIAYRVGDGPVVNVANATFAPGVRVVATYVLDLHRDYLPPGVILHYQWQIQDMAGAAVSTVWSDLKVSDPRFLWHERTQNMVTLHWYDGNNDFADAVLASASQAFAIAQQDALAPWLGTVQVFLYANEADFRSALGLGTADWTGGETFPAEHVALILAPGNNLVAAQRSVSHELTHAAVDGATTDPFGPLPTWLDEGVAMSAEGDTDPAFSDALAKGIRANHLYSVQSLSGNFPSDSREAILAYAESESLVRYVIKMYGRDHLAILIAAFRAGNTADEAFQTTIGLTTIEFQRGWRASLDPLLAAHASPQNAPTSSAADILSGVIRDVLKLFESKKSSPG